MLQEVFGKFRQKCTTRATESASIATTAQSNLSFGYRSAGQNRSRAHASLFLTQCVFNNSFSFILLEYLPSSALFSIHHNMSLLIFEKGQAPSVSTYPEICSSTIDASKEKHHERPGGRNPCCFLSILNLLS